MIFFYVIFLIFQQTYANHAIRMKETENWTSCEEFLSNTTFDFRSVIDIDWKIFFFWNVVDEQTYNIRFSLANPILIDRFKVELKGKDSSVNWTKAVLFMETTIDFSALYLTTTTPGKFRLIPSIAFQMSYLPLLEFALKLVEPGYLGIMNCQHRLCYALAAVDKIPSGATEIKIAAEKIGFAGSTNYSYIDDSNAPHAVDLNADDKDEDEQFEVENVVYQLDAMTKH